MFRGKRGVLRTGGPQLVWVTELGEYNAVACFLVVPVYIMNVKK